MAETGWTQTFGELDAAANRLSRLFRSVGLRTRRPRRPLPREPPALHRDPLGLRVRRADLHRGLVTPHHRRADLHRQRLWRPGVHHIDVQGRAGRGTARHHARRRVAADARRRDRRLRVVRGHRRPAVIRSARRASRRHRHAVLVGHDRTAEGRAARAAARSHSRPASPLWPACCVPCSAWTTRRCTCRRRRCTTPHRCGSRCRRSRSGPRWS